MCLLALIFNSHLFSTFASVEFNERSAILAVIAGMIPATELVELGHNVLEVLTVIVAEDNGELFLYLFQVDQGAEE